MLIERQAWRGRGKDKEKKGRSVAVVSYWIFKMDKDENRRGQKSRIFTLLRSISLSHSVSPVFNRIHPYMIHSLEQGEGKEWKTRQLVALPKVSAAPICFQSKLVDQIQSLLTQRNAIILLWVDEHFFNFPFHIYMATRPEKRGKDLAARECLDA